ncbi:MAG: YgcG family protein [Steroidobacteraceae bacterium]|nr:YgcG family protein [Steroidobacteraceae bacterium]MDW8258093.1 YgcG family protein [Gammaproteobacteria bacterium]
MRAVRAIAAAVLALGGSLAGAQSLQPIPPLQARVTDLTGTLTAAEQAQLEQKLAAFEARKGAQIAVLLVDTTAPEDIAQYGIRVAEAWRLGREQSDDGAILIVAKRDRRMRIEVGQGLEGALTDLVAKRIIEGSIAPLFRQGDFAGGINAGVDQMIRIVDGEPLPAPGQHWNRAVSPFESLLPFVFALIVFAWILRALFGRLLGSLVAGGAAAMFAYALLQLWLWAIGVGILAFVLSMVLGAWGPGQWASRPRHGGWGGGWSGGWGGGSFGGHGGFGSAGGFRGGGGGFSGGGASGSW